MVITLEKELSRRYEITNLLRYQGKNPEILSPLLFSWKITEPTIIAPDGTCSISRTASSSDPMPPGRQVDAEFHAVFLEGHVGNAQVGGDVDERFLPDELL